MKSTLSKVFMFVAGAAIGSAVTWKLLTEKYNRLIQEEIDSYREYCAEKYGISESEEVDEDEAPEEVVPDENFSVRDYAEKIQSAGYTDYANIDEEDVKPVKDVPTPKPYVISPCEFGECDYETVSLTYYADGILADELDEPIEDVDSVVGIESLSHFGEYEDDSVFVRNEPWKTDYEILFDPRNYADVMNLDPHQAEE